MTWWIVINEENEGVAGTVITDGRELVLPQECCCQWRSYVDSRLPPQSGNNEEHPRSILECQQSATGHYSILEKNIIHHTSSTNIHHVRCSVKGSQLKQKSLINWGTHTTKLWNFQAKIIPCTKNQEDHRFNNKRRQTANTEQTRCWSYLTKMLKLSWEKKRKPSKSNYHYTINVVVVPSYL